MPYLFYLVILAATAVIAGALPQHAQADALASARTHLGIGKRDTDGDDKIIADLGVKADVTFGRPKPKQFRIGPAIELRTVNFQTLEAAAGPAVLIPLPGETAIGLYGMVGAAARKHAPDGMVGIGTVTFGFRGYPYKGGWYGYGLNFYGSGRKHIGDESLVEWTGGVEVDIMFTAIIPMLAIRNFVTGGDPFEDEPKAEADVEAQDEPAASSDDEASSASSDEDEEEEQDEKEEE